MLEKQPVRETNCDQKKNNKKHEKMKQIQAPISERAAQGQDFLENAWQKDKGNRNQTGLPQQKNQLCFFINIQTEVRAQSHRKPLL